MKPLIATALFSFLLSCATAAPPAFAFRVVPADGVCEAGGTAELEIRCLLPEGKFIRCRRLVNGIPSGETTELPADQPFILRESMKSPGWLAIEATALDARKQPLRGNSRDSKGQLRPLKGGVGVLFAPSQIGAPAKPPADFDRFWDNERNQVLAARLETVENEMALSAREKKQFPGVKCLDVRVSCGDVPVSGCLVMPENAKPKSLPGIVTFHGAGVTGAVPRLAWGKSALVLDVNAHGIDNRQPKEYYRSLNKGRLASYFIRNWETRETCYFLGMYRRVVRALQYLTARPEWDGKTLIVAGNSQGGAQAIAAAALEPRVTACIAGIPALCDLDPEAGRLPGWPFIRLAGRISPEMRCTAEYFDSVNFAHRITCPVIVSTGMNDGTCVPTSVLRFYNNLPPGTGKEIRLFPSGTHLNAKPEAAVDVLNRLR